jgi:DNA repair photolyase
VGFNYSFNPYRGCEHGCIYCYARPTHEYLGFSAGIDFESKIMVKEDAAGLLEEEFKKKSYKPDLIVFSGNTDCYQPVERKLQITRKALQVCLKYRNPVGVITKNALIQRDIDILKELAALNLVNVTISITSLDKDIIRVMEPRTSTPEKRLETIKVMKENNIPVGVNVAPVIPGLNDEEIPRILKEAADCGASSAGFIMLRLPFSVKDLFVEWLMREFPDRANKVLNKIKEMRGGKLNSYEWGKRFTGEGELADTIKNLFNLSCRKYGLNKKDFKTDISQFSSKINNQMELF